MSPAKLPLPHPSPTRSWTRPLGVFSLAVLLAAGTSAQAQEKVILDEAFENASLPPTVELQGAQRGALLVATGSREKEAAGSVAGSKGALRFEDNASLPVHLPSAVVRFTPISGDGTMKVAFDFKQASADPLGLGVAIGQSQPDRGVFAQVYIGRNKLQGKTDGLFAAGPKAVEGGQANSSKVITTAGLTNAFAKWHRVEITFKRKGEEFDLSMELDGKKFPRLPVLYDNAPSQIQFVQFSDDGPGQNVYLIDNLRITWTPGSL